MKLFHLVNSEILLDCHKTKDPTDKYNYRPVNLAPSLKGIPENNGRSALYLY